MRAGTTASSPAPGWSRRWLSGVMRQLGGVVETRAAPQGVVAARGAPFSPITAAVTTDRERAAVPAAGQVPSTDSGRGPRRCSLQAMLSHSRAPPSCPSIMSPMTSRPPGRSQRSAVATRRSSIAGLMSTATTFPRPVAPPWSQLAARLVHTRRWGRHRPESPRGRASSTSWERWWAPGRGSGSPRSHVVPAPARERPSAPAHAQDRPSSGTCRPPARAVATRRGALAVPGSS